jgi:hypothetical protein
VTVSGAVASSRELNPDTKRNIGGRALKREAGGRLKNSSAVNGLTAVGTELANLSLDQLESSRELGE